MSQGAEIHVGDLLTKYQVPIYDDDLSAVNFDPSSASVTQLRFRMPGVAAVVVRNATPEQVTIDGVAVWCLTYEVDPNNADDVAQFHITPGKITLQGYIEYASGGKWTSNQIATDHHGRVLRVHPNL